MDFGLSGKKALVIGASRGLGGASATLLAQEGASVVAASRSGTTPADGMEGLSVDLADPASIKTLCERIKDEKFDILVNNCGGPSAGPALGQSEEGWRSAFDAMAAPIFQMTNAAIPAMAEKGWGRVVTIASSGVVQPIPNLALSNGIRGAIAGWSKTLSNEVANQGITVNMVLPGRIATDRLAELDNLRAKNTGRTLEEIQEESCSTIPAARVGQPDEFGAAVVFLCSQQASYITGSMIKVDGGAVKGIG